MLKKRIIPIQLLNNGRLVKSIDFGNFRDVGDPVKSSSVYNSQYADELMLLNVSREKRSIADLLQIIVKISEVSFMPLAIGGGISSPDDAALLIRNGADKIVVNSVAYRDLNVITETSNRFGAQAVIVGIDVRWDADLDDYRLYSRCGSAAENVGLEQHIARVVAAGAGEIMVQSIDRDGSMQGFDLDAISRAMTASPTPVIGAGGSGNYESLKDAFITTGVSALACGSLFNFSDSNPLRAKAYLSNHGLNFKKV
ncbi:imidazoleglycerol-phosphate synthase [Devosia limi DSM 17137]|uniref:Imidazole glycerol phosphate synthase subunit HisF n=1 Tax=Devosia limi DSM 17137 TaxID=1121477 RepID=A0A0F5LAU8_9HYPH|nr:imidazole glycerol phosphate synthase cyclase subunit [Devosia limi]KKB79410.1 imidazoleglycerol-phosphate synthase [Devosia limi DSM 17137]SHF32157.1 cyclase [Devosia limi DSM 17137]